MDHHAGQVKNKVKTITEGVLLRTVGRHAGRRVKKGKPRNKAGDSGYTGEVAKTKDNDLVPPLADVELSKTAAIGGGPNIGEGVQLSRMPSLDMDLIWDALLVSDA
nr:ethylene-responsive transcription factor ERF062-like [Tanacetum cinerariifolium]